MIDEENSAASKQEPDDNGTDSVCDQEARLIQSHSYDGCDTVENGGAVFTENYERIRIVGRVDGIPKALTFGRRTELLQCGQERDDIEKHCRAKSDVSEHRFFDGLWFHDVSHALGK